MTFGLFQRSSLGHLLWWSGSTPAPPVEVSTRWLRAGLPQVKGTLPTALEQTMRALPAIPVLERSGVYWLSPEFGAQLTTLRAVLCEFHGWELHTVPVQANAQTLEALRSSALRWIESTLGQLSIELEALLTQPRLRASLLVRQLDVIEAVRRHAEVQARHLGLSDEALPARLEAWAARIDAALCARIVA